MMQRIRYTSARKNHVKTREQTSQDPARIAITRIRASFAALLLCLAIVMISQPAFSSADSAKPLNINAAYHAHVINAPDWIEWNPVQTQAHIPAEDITEGVYYLLVDRQALVSQQGELTEFHHYAIHISNSEGLEDNGQLELSYATEFETLQLHHVAIFRDGRWIDKVPSLTRMSYRAENDRNRLMYHGMTEVSYIIEDLRVGDILSYSYSREGKNPATGDLYSLRYSLDWSVPVEEVRTRVIWQKTEPLYFKMTHPLRHATLTTETQAEQQLFSYYKYKQRPVFDAEDTPLAFTAYNILEFSNTASWSDIVSWGQPLYQHAQITDNAVVDLAQEMLNQYDNDKARVAAALRFVSQEIRYLGIEIGDSALKPSTAATTLARRYGDCKDKTVLLITLLDLMDIQASPALVHSRRKDAIVHALPSIGQFDHVITTLELEGKRYWLDPTRARQFGPLDQIAPVDFRMALILEAEQTELTPIVISNTQVLETLTDTFNFTFVPRDPVAYIVTADYTGDMAEWALSKYNRSSLNEVTQEYEAYYQKQFPTLHKTAMLEMMMKEAAGKVQLKERYLIPDAWSLDSATKQWEFTVFPYQIWQQLDYDWIGANRKTPVHIKHPVNVVQHIRVLLDGKDWEIDDKLLEITNDYFSFSYHSEYDKENQVHHLRYHFLTHQHEIPVADQAQFLADIDAVKNELNDYVYYVPDDPVSTSSPFNKNVVRFLKIFSEQLEKEEQQQK